MTATSMKWFMYDGHGNMVRTMDTGFQLSAYQWRGVWGERQTGTLQPGKGYCANLGHQEDETGLVYMRARYYEPTTGRFISEDPARDGGNWYLYADGNPVTNADVSGQWSLSELSLSFSLAEGLGSAALNTIFQQIMDGSINWWEVLIAGVAGAAFARIMHWYHYGKKAAWLNARGDIRIYIMKFIGIGTETSKHRYRLYPLWRMLTSSGGVRLFSFFYSSYLDSWMDEDD